MNRVKPRQPYFQSGHPLNLGLHSAWLFSEGGGGNASTAMRQRCITNPANDAILNAGSTPRVSTAGRAGYAISGAAAAFTFPINPILGAGDFTVLMRGAPATSGNGSRRGGLRFGASSPNNHGGSLFLSTANKVEFDLSGVAGPTSTNTITDGRWHSFGVTSRASTMQIYLDGFADGTSAAMSPVITGASNAIGLDFAINLFGSPFDDVRIWTRALSPAEVMAYHQSNYDEFTPFQVSVRSGVPPLPPPGTNNPIMFNWLGISPLSPGSVLAAAWGIRAYRAMRVNAQTARRKFLSLKW